jgi:ElaB/YqjD/DUF883 family membrane-anchored ribosome-binding protein
MVQMCERFEKKLHDLELTRMISMQMAPDKPAAEQRHADGREDPVLHREHHPPVEEPDGAGPGLEHSRQAAAAQHEVTDMTNELLKKNADLLKMGTVETAKEAERSIVDIETLQHTNQQLIATLDEVLRSRTTAAAKRKAEEELGRIEGELKQKLGRLGRWIFAAYTPRQNALTPDFSQGDPRTSN